MPPKKIKQTAEEKRALKIKKRREKKLQIAEHKRQVKRDVLVREIKYGDLTLQNYEQKWRQVLINIAIPKIREEFVLAWHHFELVVDYKDFAISMLMDEIDVSQEQNMMNLRSHMENIDQLIQRFRDMVDGLDNDYNENVMMLETEHREDMDEIEYENEVWENYVKTILHQLQVVSNNDIETIEVDYFFKLDNKKTKVINMVETLRAILEKTHEEMWIETRKFLDAYERHSKHRKFKHDALKVQDDSIQTLLTYQLDKIYHLYQSIKNLKQKLIEREAVLMEKEEDLDIEFQIYDSAFSTLKNDLVEARKRDFGQLVVLTEEFRLTTEYLTSIKVKGNHILQLATICRKLETTQEKILPFPVMEPQDFVYYEEFSNDYLPVLTAFCQRAANVEASRHSINEEKTYLLDENKKLQKLYHRSCKCLDCPEETAEKMVKMFSVHINAADELDKYRKHSSSEFSDMLCSRFDDIDD